MKIFLATNNMDKRNEFNELLNEVDVELVYPEQFGKTSEIEESGINLEENALIKARWGAKFSGLPSLADDTGLEVQALQGAPGVYSARYAGNQASYQDNVRKLLKQMTKLEGEDRTAQFRTVLCFYIPGHHNPYLFQGVVKGIIVKNPTGDNGFGYDPVFVPRGSTLTFAQMSLGEKNNYSHRSMAINNFKNWFKQVDLYTIDN